MQPINYILFSILLLITEAGFSQSREEKAFQVRLSPLNLLDATGGVIQPGLQKRFNRKWAVSVDYGFQFSQLSIRYDEDGRIDHRYYKAKAELKYFLPPAKKARRFLNQSYVSVRGMYFPQTYTKENDFLFRDRKVFQYQTSSVTRNVVALAVIAGEEKVLGNFVFDVYCGPGLRRLSIRHQTTGELELPDGVVGREWDFDTIDERQGHFYRLHIVMGIKVGYILNRKRSNKLPDSFSLSRFHGE